MLRSPVTQAITASPSRLQLILKQIPAFTLGVLLIALLSERVSEIEMGAVSDAVVALRPGQWLGALALAALSFWAVGHYDAVVHRHLATGRKTADAQRAGLIAIAIGQTAGMGVLTGTLVRLRMLPGVGFGGALRLTLTVSALFLLGWAIVTALAFAILPGPFRVFGLLALGVVPFVIALSLFASAFRLFGQSIRIPTLRTLVSLTGLAALDTITAGLCLFVLLPPETVVTLSILMPAFLLALGVGLMTGTPGGVGAFEVCLLALLPAVPADPLLAGVLAWRVVYFVIPALIALGFLAKGAVSKPMAMRIPQPIITGMPLPSWVEAQLMQSQRAEAGLLRQGDKLWLSLTAQNTTGGAVLGRTGQVLVMLGDPVGGADIHQAINALSQAASREAREACLYKVGARQVLAAKTKGWKVAPVAREGWLCPKSFRLDTPARRQLRRKLRKAQKEDVRIERTNHALPLTEMARISNIWANDRGGERGFSMGRFSPEYVQAQRVYLAYVAGRLVGFLTLHVSQNERTVDLMRCLPEAPDGTMHALVLEAIEDARDEHCPRLSLAALPHPEIEKRLSHLPTKLRPSLGTAGLSQFKTAFAPEWETLYIAAPSWPALILASHDIMRAVNAPAPLKADRHFSTPFVDYPLDLQPA